MFCVIKNFIAWVKAFPSPYTSKHDFQMIEKKKYKEKGATIVVNVLKCKHCGTISKPNYIERYIGDILVWDGFEKD